MVPEIEEFCSELERVFLLKRESLGHRKVPILLVRSAEGITRDVSIKSSLRPRRVGSSTCGSKTGSVQVSIQMILNPPGGVELAIGSACAGKSGRPATKISEDSPAGAVRHRERQPALISDDPTNAPTLKELVVEETIVWHRQVIRVTEDEAVWPVKITYGTVSIWEVV